MASDLKTLIKQRGVVKAQLTRIQTYLSKVGSNPRLTDLEIRKTKLQDLNKEFETVQFRIECLDESEEQENVRIEFEDLYFECCGEVESLLRSVAPIPIDRRNDSPSPSSSNACSGQVHSIVPKVKIKDFDGNFAEWNSFHDAFKTVIHDDEKMPVVHKFQLLKSHLKGDAAAVIDVLNGSEENYLLAWESLNEEFNKPRKIIEAHIRALFELKTASKSSPASIRMLLTKSKTHVKALRSLGEPVDWHEMLIYILTSKLDKDTRTVWEQSLESGTRPTTEDLFKFFSKYACDAEPVNLVTHSENQTHRATKKERFSASLKPTRITQGYVSTSNEPQCPICKGTHQVASCHKFLALNSSGRYSAARKACLCINCLRAGHWTTQCRSSSCRRCQGRHHTLLHSDSATKESPNLSEDASAPSTSQNCSATLTAVTRSEILLSTARIKIVDNLNKEHECRVLLDSGSQTNFITERFANHLQLPKTQVDLPAFGIGQKATKICHKVKTEIRSRNSFFSQRVEFMVIPNITTYLPSQTVNRVALNIPSNLSLADPRFHEPAEIDALLGEQLFYKLLSYGQIRLSNKTTILQKTKLGWIVSGSAESMNSSINKPVSHLVQFPLEEQITKFWELEECPSKKEFSHEEEECERRFRTETTRDVTGRYIVRLPFNEKKNQLGVSYDLARKRFLSLERRLNREPNLRESYASFLEEYEDLGHMTAIPDTNRHEGFFLPHHAVCKLSSVTTKIRVVFDGSAKSMSGLSLNDTLLVGPKIQEDLFSLLARFRIHAYVFTADIEKMFRQIQVHPEDAIYQKILWRKCTQDPIQTFRLNTVTYGTTSAPFLAVRCLQQLAQDGADSFPRAATVFLNDFYMDDLITGTNSREEAKLLRDEIIALARSGGFNLRQWASNEVELIKDIQNQDRDHEHVCLDSELVPVKKILGINWHPGNDTLSYSIHISHEEKGVTKRIILSKIAQLFDPLGLLGPVIITAKIMMQTLWKSKLGWDEDVPPSIRVKWNDFITKLPILTKICIPRKIVIENATDLQIHGFSDASEKAYGACIYLRSVNSRGEIKTQLVCAKSRVAPLKVISLPRLELCAAFLLVKLYTAIEPALRLTFSKQKFWTDSMIVLHWINSSSHTLKTFVANRISNIQSHTHPSDWCHVQSADNPADLLSRGQSPSDFREGQHWFQGPFWLAGQEDDWPKFHLSHVEVPDKRVITLINRMEPNEILTRFSSFVKLQRIMAYILRFITNSSRKRNLSGPLTCEELQLAHMRIITLLQSEVFPREIQDLGKNNTVHKRSKLFMLNPFLDEVGIIRVGGRLRNASITYNQKFPIILPRSHHVTRIIIQAAHIRNMHAGTIATLNDVRQRYWPIDGKNITRFIIHQCLRCFKTKPRTTDQYIMGNLPKDRVTSIRPFKNVGVDYCGPFFIKEKRHRNQRKLKVYVAVFVCFATKAIHLELVSDLTTEAFLGCLKRFFARRGLATNIYSDNATNFTGAKKELEELKYLLNSAEHNERVAQKLLIDNVKWHFSPPRAPHFGGLWEAAVKSFKHHFIRTIGDALFTFEQLNTYVIEVEAILNSRPLTPLSSDPNDLAALTPAYFLIGESITAMPEHDLSDMPSNRLSHWQHIQRVKQHFWARWHKEYLNEVSLRSKWRTGSTIQLQVGDLVLLKEDNIPPLRWMLGRIAATHPGEDGILRVVSVKTTTGTYKRSILKLCPLPCDPAI